jgi:hypothetical protein
MKIVKDQSDQKKPKSTKAPIFTEEFRRKLRLEFIANHNAKIQKMIDDGTYDKWLRKG